MTSEPRYYEGVDSLLEFPSVQDADLQLRQNNGWEIVRIEKLTNDEVDGQGVVKRSEKLVFILGHRTSKTVGNPAPTHSQQSATPSATGSQSPQRSKMTGMSSPCKYCQGPIWWVAENGKNVPKNEDGSRHDCR